MISARYTPALCVLLALALIPTALHTYAGVRVSDGRTTEAIPAVLAGLTSMATKRNATWGTRKFDSGDWIERRYTDAKDEIVLTVVRSYDLKRLYHHPELEIVDASFGRPERVYVNGDRTRPVHVLREAGERPAVGVYLLHYDEGLVDNPMLFQMRTAGELLVSGRKPMTLLFAYDEGVAADEPVDRLRATSLLFAALEAFTRGPGAQAAR